MLEEKSLSGAEGSGRGVRAEARRALPTLKRRAILPEGVSGRSLIAARSTEIVPSGLMGSRSSQSAGAP